MKAITENPFRILGLYANTSEREVVARMDELRTLAAIGRVPRYPSDPAFLPGPDRSARAVADACTALRNPELRLRAALTWAWSVPGSAGLDSSAQRELASGALRAARALWEEARAKLSRKAPAWTACTCNLLLTHWLALDCSFGAVVFCEGVAGVVRTAGQLCGCEHSRAVLGRTLLDSAEAPSESAVAAPVARTLETVLKQATGLRAGSHEEADLAIAMCLYAIDRSTHFASLKQLLPSVTVGGSWVSGSPASVSPVKQVLAWQEALESVLLRHGHATGPATAAARALRLAAGWLRQGLCRAAAVAWHAAVSVASAALLCLLGYVAFYAAACLVLLILGCASTVVLSVVEYVRGGPGAVAVAATAGPLVSTAVDTRTAEAQAHAASGALPVVGPARNAFVEDDAGDGDPSGEREDGEGGGWGDSDDEDDGVRYGNMELSEDDLLVDLEEGGDL